MHEQPPRSDQLSREQLLVELARRETGDLPTEENLSEDSTLEDLRTRLKTLVDDLQQQPPVDDFAEESGCREAIERILGENAPAIAASPSIIGRQLGPYQIVAQIGQGGMGTVYRALHSKLNRIVALKILASNRQATRTGIARFQREMKALGRLNHPNIVAVHDAGEARDMHYLVMEYVDGIDLSSLVRRLGPLSVADACEIIRQACLGLQRAHESKIVHRDVKPSNLMLAARPEAGGEPFVKLLDFGLASLSLDPTDAELTTSDQIMGSLNYMAPEQFQHSRRLDAAADIYALGATLYRLLSGVAPFEQQASESPLTLLDALANTKPAPLSELRPEIPQELSQLVQQMMAKSPADRIGSARQVAERLRLWSNSADLTALLAHAEQAEESTPDAYQASQPAVVVARAPKAEQPSLNTSLPATLTALVLMALVGWWTLTHRTPEDSALVAGSTPAGQPAPKSPAPPEQSPWQQSRQAAEWVLSIGGSVTVESEGETEFVNVYPGEPLPSWPLQLESVDLSTHEEITDRDLSRFRDLRSIDALNLNFTQIGDAGLANLGPRFVAYHIGLDDTKVTDRGIAALPFLHQLRTVHLDRAPITDAALVSLAKAGELGELTLNGCQITDAGLSELHGLKHLTFLNLLNTDASSAGIAALQKALPACVIESDVSDGEAN